MGFGCQGQRLLAIPEKILYASPLSCRTSENLYTFLENIILFHTYLLHYFHIKKIKNGDFFKKTKVCYVITTQLDFSLRITATAPIKLRRYEYESFSPNSDIFCYACCLILWSFHQTKGLVKSHFCLNAFLFYPIKSVRSNAFAGTWSRDEDWAYISPQNEKLWNGLHSFPLYIAVKAKPALCFIQIPIWTNMLH